jgi:hypothetical protein
MSFSDGIGLASLYFALVGLLGSFFFIHLGQWLSDVLATEAKWLKVAIPNQPRLENYDQKLECYRDAVKLSTKWSWLGWLVVTTFLAIVYTFLIILSAQVGNKMFTYVSFPCGVFLTLYLFFSIAMLKIGYSKARGIRSKAGESL